MQAFHFNNGKTLNYTDNPLPPHGVWLKENSAELCYCGLHASVEPYDAYVHNKGPFLDLVEISGKGEFSSDKVVGTHRMRIATVDMTNQYKSMMQSVALKIVAEQGRLVELAFNCTLLGDALLGFDQGAAKKLRREEFRWDSIHEGWVVRKFIRCVEFYGENIPYDSVLNGVTGYLTRAMVNQAAKEAFESFSVQVGW